MRIVALTTAALALTIGAASASSFDTLDRNNDGAVSKAEFLKIYGPELDTSNFWYVDQNNDGVIDVQEHADATNGAQGMFFDG